MRQQLLEQLRRDEGLRLQAYRCTAGKLTIGYGHNLEARPYLDGQLIPHVIDEDLADRLLLRDVEQTWEALAARYGAFSRLSPERQDALVNMAFQMGIDGVMAFKRMLAALAAGQYERAYAEALDSDWAKQTPARANRVARQLMYGEYQEAK